MADTMGSVIRLSDVPELSESAGGETIIINDSGTIKQIPAKKFVPDFSNSQKLEELVGAETVLVNDNGIVKQVAVDKLVPDKGSNKCIFDMSSAVDPETFLAALEADKDIWVHTDGEITKVTSFDYATTCGANYIFGTYSTSTSLPDNLVSKVVELHSSVITNLDDAQFERFKAAFGIVNTTSEVTE